MTIWVLVTFKDMYLSVLLSYKIYTDFFLKGGFMFHCKASIAVFN